MRGFSEPQASRHAEVFAALERQTLKQTPPLNQEDYAIKATTAIAIIIIITIIIIIVVVVVAAAVVVVVVIVIVIVVVVVVVVSTTARMSPQMALVALGSRLIAIHAKGPCLWFADTAYLSCLRMPRTQVWNFDATGEYFWQVYLCHACCAPASIREPKVTGFVFMAAMLLLNMASQREQILDLLSHMERPPDVDVEEWQELLLLEAPSILGMAAPQAAALEASEPTFPSGDSFSEEASNERSADSLAGYSPSPDRSPITRRGFNLLVPNGLRLDALSAEHESEHIAMQALLNRWLWEEDLLALTLHLPSCTRHFQHSLEMNGSCSFLMGAYIHGCSAGILNNSKRFPLVTLLITSVVRSVAPQAWFSSAGISLNDQSNAHKDSNNSAVVQNTLIPASHFQHGELWLEDGTGQHEVEGRLRRLVPLVRPFICFNPRVRHATQAWLGNRLVIIGYHVRNPEFLSAADKIELCRIGFRLYEGR